MERVVRALLILVSLGQLLVTLLLIVQWPPVTALWPFPGSTSLTYTFAASIVAAAAASTMWAAASENYGALAGIGLDYLAIFGALTIVLTRIDLLDSSMRPLYLAGSALLAIMGVALFAWSARVPIDAQPAQPRLVRWSFVVFVAGLVIVGGALILQTPAVIPWSIMPQLGVVIGCMFIGAAVYFAYSLLRPSWLNSAGQLLGFLAYDLVLIVPFMTRLQTTAPEFFVGLTVYTAVVVYSALLAIYYLFVNGPTRRATWMRSGRQ